jgi:hypothetical protein
MKLEVYAGLFGDDVYAVVKALGALLTQSAH